MQKTATYVFIYSSIAFGIIGISLAIFGGANDNMQPNIVLSRLLMTTVFLILPSFALSVAGKYLNNN